MGKSCWRARLAIQQHFPIQILLVFLRFKLPPKFIFQCYRIQTWVSYLFFPALSISAIHEVLGIKFKDGRSRDPQLQKVYLAEQCNLDIIKFNFLEEKEVERFIIRYI